MINFTQNLYTTQWLDLVFQNRNKSYGAYELRKHDGETTLKAFFYACVLFSSLITLPWFYGQLADAVPPIKVPELSDPLEVNMIKIHHPKPLTPAAQAPAKQIPIKIIQYTAMVVVPADQTVVEPPAQQQLTQAVISSLTAEGVTSSSINPAEITSGVETGTGIIETPPENTVYSIDGIEKYPEFPGGQEAFSKYLSRNLRYPGMAAENGVQGRVFVSFIIERNGDLSHIKILSGIGSGCDEEAIRVLTKSPQWKPGIQNKQNVRVAYTIPINFRLPN